MSNNTDQTAGILLAAWERYQTSIQSFAEVSWKVKSLMFALTTVIFAYGYVHHERYIAIYSHPNRRSINIDRRWI